MAKGAGAASRNLVVDVLTSYDDAVLVAPEWDELALATPAQPFGLPGLAIPWWEHLGRGELRIVTVRRGDGTLAGLAPLFERRRAGLRFVRFLGHGLGAVGEVLVGPSRANIEESLWDALGSDRRLVIAPADYRSGGAGFNALRRSVGRAFHAVLSDECPVVDLTRFAGTEALLAPPEKSGVRKKLARAWRSTEGHEVSLDIAWSADEVAIALDRVDGLYSRAEAAHPRLHLDSAPYRPFFRGSMSELANRGQLAFLTLNIDGRPAAFDAYVVVGPLAYAILGRYEPALAEFSPGLLLMDHGVRWAVGAGIETIDWQLGADPYKLRWATGTYNTFNVVAGDPAVIGPARSVLSASEAIFEMKDRVEKWRT